MNETSRPSENDPLPTDEQRKLLCDMMHHAFVEIRSLGWEGKAAQAADLADAFHNLPKEMYGWGGWSKPKFRGMLEAYHQKYRRDYYVRMLGATFDT